MILGKLRHSMQFYILFTVIILGILMVAIYVAFLK